MNVNRRILAVILILIATGLLSLLPEAKIENLTHTSYNYYTDLAQHSLYYLALTMCSCWLFLPTPPWKIGLSLFGLSLLLEIAQHFSPKRSFSIHDIVANLAGISLGVVLFMVLRRRTTPVSQS